MLRFTQQGMQNIQEEPNRIGAARQAFGAAGARLREFYPVTGQYDLAGILEAPVDETGARVGLAVSPIIAALP